MPPPDNTSAGFHDTSPDDSPASQNTSPLNQINLLSEVLLNSDPTGSLNMNRYSAVYGNDLYVNANPIPSQIRNLYRESSEYDDSSTEANDDIDTARLPPRDNDNNNNEPQTMAPFRFNDTVELDPELLRSDIQPNERLLLSSARLNTTNTNTLITSAVPLRRSNALRASHRNRHSYTRRAVPVLQIAPQQRHQAIPHLADSEPLLNSNIPSPLLPTPASIAPLAANSGITSPSSLSYFPLSNRFPIHQLIPNPRRGIRGSHSWVPNINEAKWYAKVMKIILKDLQATKLAQGMSPLFYSKSHKHTLLDTSIDDAFDGLRVARGNRRWSASRDAACPAERDQRRAPDRKRHWRLPGHDMPALKRRAGLQSHKQPPHVARAVADELSASGGDNIPFESMSYDNLETLSNLLPSSYLSCGSTFSFEGPESQTLEMAFSNVDYATGEMSAVLLGSTLPLLAFLTGDSPLARDKTILKKLRILDHLILLRKPADFDTVEVPMAGLMVDFKTNDLRFLTSKYSSKSKTMIQISEWTRLEPFNQFQEACLFKEALCAYRALKSHIRETQSLEVQTTQSISSWSGSASTKKLNSLQISDRKELVNIARSIKYAFDSSVLASREQYDDVDIDTETEMERKLKRKLKRLKLGLLPLSALERKKSGYLFRYEQSQLQKSAIANRMSERWFVDLSAGCFNEKLANQLAECLTCEHHCSLNVHLNYIIFTLEIDFSSLLDNLILLIDRLLRLNSDFANAEPRHPSLLLSLVLDSKKIVLLCSLNRKNGSLSVHNTRPFLEYTNVYQHSFCPISGPISSPVNMSLGSGGSSSSVFESVFSGISLGGGVSNNVSNAFSNTSEEDFETSLDGFGIHRFPPRSTYKDPYLQVDSSTTIKGCFRMGHRGAYRTA